MSITLYSLVGFGLWTLLLATAVLALRGLWVVKGERAINSYPADKPHAGPEAYHRLIRAHLNSLEFLPIIAVLFLVAAQTGQTGLTDLLAPWILLARVVQSLLHISAGNVLIVTLRATAFVAQVGLAIWIGFDLLA